MPPPPPPPPRLFSSKLDRGRRSVADNSLFSSPLSRPKRDKAERTRCEGVEGLEAVGWPGEVGKPAVEEGRSGGGKTGETVVGERPPCHPRQDFSEALLKRLEERWEPL